MNSSVELLTFSMRATPPKAGSDWFRIVSAKKGEKTTKIYIYDEIGFWGTNAKDFAAQLNEIDTDEIELHLNSPGGSVFDGLAIYNALKDHSSTIIAKVDGVAASTASFIMQAADIRMISRNAQVMIHDAKAFAGGNEAQMMQAAKLLGRISNEIADIYAVRSGQTKSAEDFREIMKSGDKWYNGNEALEDGLVDEVTDNPEEDEETPEEAENRVWNTAEVEEFLNMAPHKLAASNNHVTITNRVEEALMSGTTPPSTTPPAVPTPPAPTASTTPPEPSPTPAPTPTPSPAPSPGPTGSGFQLIVNGGTVTDLATVQNHINGLELFKKETIETGRKSFVAQLAKDRKILANKETLDATEAFALGLSSEQFEQWKATMSAAPSSSLFDQHGVGPGDSQAPVNGDPKVTAITSEIATLEEIVQSHRDSGMPEDSLKEKDSYKRLQVLKSKQAAQ